MRPSRLAASRPVLAALGLVLAMSRPVLVALGPLLVALVLFPCATSAQLGETGPDGVLSEADRLYLAGRPEQSLELLEAHIANDSSDYGAFWRAARAAVVLGIGEEGSRRQNRWLDPALLFAERAVELRPDGLDGIYWRGVSAGRRAMNAAPGYAVELAQIVYDDAHAILAVDSLHGGAHNMLGKLNYEVMSLSRIKRALARTFMGNEALDDTSWEQAEDHLRRAVECWPGFVLFHFDLGQLYRKRGRRDEAVAEFRRTLALPSVHPTDVGLKEQAAGYLTEWAGGGATTVR